jgi:DNA-binding MarR family transcriptional regulator
MSDARKRDRAPERRARRPLEQSVGYELGRAFRSLNRFVSAATRAHGLSAVQGNILITLWALGPMPIGELQQRMAYSSSAFTGALDRMESAGLLRRVPSPSDRRSSIVEPVTWSGSRRGAVIDALIAAEDEFLAGLTRDERARLLALLRRIGREPRS